MASDEQVQKTIADCLKLGNEQLTAAEIENPRLDVRLLLAETLSVDTSYLFGYPEKLLNDGQFRHFQAMINRRLKREPVSKIIGRKEFWSLEFKVSRDTLDPRPDSETLIEAVLESLVDKTESIKILDLGTGTGCLLLTLLSELQAAKGLGIDISDKALAIAKDNAEALGLSDRVAFQLGNWCDGVKDGWDIIISNPPYIGEDEKKILSPEVLNYDPALALFAENNGMKDYQTFIPQAASILKNNGMLVVEAGHTQAEAINALMSDAGLMVYPAKKDLGGIARACIARKCI
ncbi:peptide chain release factor N(5)-glutamine methyltransferase [uncultured Kiloniella sp.]|uniref:peptide chain release factor N(5)-glutamine methyltransferase n=1 Tax=uncultured Kiloniella sp. TaxID=1133091 RepID=UPI0026103B5F|nr:peptide chain release factor N(5)-glutamine methyltransferase [uncultured Kiloniella sp.]